jgi:SAM-dependent methyltransferase
LLLEQLRQVAASLTKRRGWDFSDMQITRDPIPWDYVDLVRRYLQPTSDVLDIGTGGGEVFLSLAPSFGRGVGIDIDPTMIQVAHENTPPSMKDRISFRVMQAKDLQFPDDSFDVVLNRQSTIIVAPIVRVLRPEGVFITQQVGRRNSLNILTAFGWGPESFGAGWWQEMSALVEAFEQHGCAMVARAEYDVRTWFRDVESPLFWLNSVPLPETFDLEAHWPGVQRFMTQHHTPAGFESNEHRELLIVRKSAA